MDFNQQSSGSLLFLLENEYLKKEIRNIEQINKRLIHIKSGINFNNICLKEGLKPTLKPTEACMYKIYIYILYMQASESNSYELISIVKSFHRIKVRLQ